MTVKILLKHRSQYAYDKPVQLSSQVLRLKPTSTTHINITHYSVNIHPKYHEIRWQSDPFGNSIACVTIPEKTHEFIVDIDLAATLTPTNPFDLLLENDAVFFPFKYKLDLEQALQVYLKRETQELKFHKWLEKIKLKNTDTISFIINLNQLIGKKIQYVERLEPGVQPCHETLRKASGSCRDLAWLLIHALRHFNLASRFVSGYQIQVTEKQPRDFNANMHAWVEVYIPGAGWIGLDPTSGLLVNNTYIPLCAAPDYAHASPISGTVEPCNVEVKFEIKVHCMSNQGHDTLLFPIERPSSIAECGTYVDNKLEQLDARLTMGSEPTFTSKKNYDSPEWCIKALGSHKLESAKQLFFKLQKRLTKDALPLHAKGKWCAGEPFPRWSLNCYWLKNNKPMWHNPALVILDEEAAPTCTYQQMETFIHQLAKELRISKKTIIKCYENAHSIIIKNYLMKATSESELITSLKQTKPTLLGFVLPIPISERQEWDPVPWSATSDIFLQDSELPIGFRLPSFNENENGCSTLCVELRNHKLYLFLPQLDSFSHYLELLNKVEKVAELLNLPLILEGHEPPPDEQLNSFKITPDPGVLEINMPPAASWHELVEQNFILYSEAERLGLTTEKFLLEGRRIGTGGGHHITIGSMVPTDSVLLRRPDLLRSIITFWQHHPSLSYLFSGTCIGATSQAPRVDESRIDYLQELEIALEQLTSNGKKPCQHKLRSLQYYLTDLVGNPHRTEICVDKLLLSSDQSALQGLLEFRAFEMPPNLNMCIQQLLLVRALIAYLCEKPYHASFIRWGEELHSRFLLPFFIWDDFSQIISDLNNNGYMLNLTWFESFFHYRFPYIGNTKIGDVSMELRLALEPWNVIGEETTSAFDSRTVDSSLERIQIQISGLIPEHHIITCNGIALPLQGTGKINEHVSGVRFKAREVPITLHPGLPVLDKLEFDLVDTVTNHSLGGCGYVVNYQQDKLPPKDAKEAEKRLCKRFKTHGKKQNMIHSSPSYPNAQSYYLDLCRISNKH